ncbi:hypothetical protein ABZ502_17605 [Streptomyces abikoensis]|uniref:hypothetical protein n=1 Tax=Streptomyces abikoensis TaxID=97398 RepID=UPI0033F272AC
MPIFTPLPARDGLTPARPARQGAGATLIAGLLVGMLTACGSSSGSDDAVSGLRDDVRHWPKQTTRDTRPRMVERCVTKTKRVKHTATNGSGKQRTTQSWYTTESYRDCRKAQQGTETYERVVRAARWCVELDNVGGDSRRDNHWYEVDAGTYAKAAAAKEGTKLTFVPLRTGC